jgi:hypothetical protein
VVLIISKTKNFNHFLDEVISKGQIFFLDSGGRVRTAVSHTHTHTDLKVVFTAFEAFRSEHSKQTK